MTNNIGNDPKGTGKLDNAPADGLLGTPGSIAYLLAEIERHFHNVEKWFGLAVTPVGETHRADRMNGVVEPFTLTTGNSDFGPWVQVLGSDDTPVNAAAVKFDAHKVLVVDTNSTSPYIVQIVGGESADIAAKIAAEEFSEFPYISQSNLNDSGETPVKSRRQNAGTKVWARAACKGQNAVTISAYLGIHEYEG